MGYEGERYEEFGNSREHNDEMDVWCDTENRRRSVELRERLGIECVAEVVRHGRLGWFGHVDRKNKSDWVSAGREFEVEGVRERGEV
jgi:hypothetical protein